MEYLVTMTTHVPDGTPEQAVDDVRAREAAHSRDLATEGQREGRGSPCDRECLRLAVRSDARDGHGSS
jgi:Muconolactone delta-isomerase